MCDVKGDSNYRFTVALLLLFIAGSLFGLNMHVARIGDALDAANQRQAAPIKWRKVREKPGRKR